MSEYNKTILTNQGLDLMARANKGTAKFTITRAATSTEQLANKSMADLQQLTELPSLMQYGVINDVADSTQDKSIVIGTELLFNNKDLSNGYNINTIGLFAKEDGQDKEILYAITTAVIPESMPDYKNKVLFKLSLTMFVAVGRTDNVSVIVDDSNLATKADLTKVKKELDGKANASDVYNKTEINEKLDQAGKLKKISVNGGVPVEPDAGGVANIVIKEPDLSNLAKKTWLGGLYGATKSGVKANYTNSIINPDTIIETGVYRIDSCNVMAKVNNNLLSGAQWGWLIVLNYDETGTTNALYQFLIVNEIRSERVVSLQYKTYPTFLRILNSNDYNILDNKINNQTYNAPDYVTGLAYSKAHPNTWVTTP